MPAESGPPSFQVQDFHPFWLWSSKRQHACYRPWHIIPQPPLASTALAALSSMDNIEGSLDPGAPVQGIVSEDEEEALEELLLHDLVPEPDNTVELLRTATSAWHRLAEDPAAINNAVPIIESRTNTIFELQRAEGQQEIASIQASQQDP